MTITASLHLANAASIDIGGQVSVLGFGWRITGPPPLPGHVILVEMRAAGEDVEKPTSVLLELVDEHGRPATQGSDEAPQPVRIEGSIEPPSSTPRPPGLPAGANLIAEIGPGIVLDPGYYEWVLSLNGESRADWRYKFYVRAKADEYPPRADIKTPNTTTT